jgi:hypothetical protein
VRLARRNAGIVSTNARIAWTHNSTAHAHSGEMQNLSTKFGYDSLGGAETHCQTYRYIYTYNVY